MREESTSSALGLSDGRSSPRRPADAIARDAAGPVRGGGRGAKLGPDLPTGRAPSAPNRVPLAAPRGADSCRRHGLAGLVDCSSSAFPCMSVLASHHSVIEPAGQTPHTSPGRAARGRGFDPEDLAASMQEGLCQPGVWARGPDRERQTSWDGRGPGRCQGAGPRGGRRSLGGRGEAWALSPPERAPWASSGSRREAGWPIRGLSLVETVGVRPA